MSNTAEYVINPYTNRRVKVGSRKYKDLINTGAIAPEYEYESDNSSEIDINEMEWEKPEYSSEEEEEINNEIISDDEIYQEEMSDYDNLTEEDLSKIKEYVEYIKNNK